MKSLCLVADEPDTPADKRQGSRKYARLGEPCYGRYPHRARIIDIKHLILGGLLIALAASLTGCGESKPATYPVTVTLRPGGEPAVGARISFRSVDQGVAARGVIGDDGTCQMTTYESNDGVLAGKHKIAIGQPALMGDPDDPQRQYAIARQLSSFSTSTLEVTVTENEADNQFDISADAQ